VLTTGEEILHVHATVVKLPHHLNCVRILPDKIQKCTFYVVHKTLECTFDGNSVKSCPISTTFSPPKLVINLTDWAVFINLSSLLLMCACVSGNYLQKWLLVVELICNHS